MILRIMTAVPSKLRLDASTPRERPRRRSRRRMRVRAPTGAPGKIIGIHTTSFFCGNGALAQGILMILRIMTVVPSKLRLDASTPPERPGRRWRRRVRVRAPIGAPGKILGIPYHEFLQESHSSQWNIDDSENQEGLSLIHI